MQSKPNQNRLDLRLALLVLLLSAAIATRFTQPQARIAVGMNLSGNLRTVPFIDIMNQTSGFKTVAADAPSTRYPRGYFTGVQDSVERDAHGYPLELPYVDDSGTHVFHTHWNYGWYFSDPEAPVVVAFPAGRYTCLYDGEGEIEFYGDADGNQHIVGGLDTVTIVSSEPGKIVFDLKPYYLLGMRINRSTKGNHIRNVRILLPGWDETNYDDQQPFNPVFLDRVRPFSCFRFMDWMHTNHSDAIWWDQRRPRSFYSQWSGCPGGGGIAIEYMIELCNQLQIDPWFNVPHAADTSYIRQFAEMVRDNLDSSLEIYLEYSNEGWNGLFDVAGWVKWHGAPDEYTTQGELVGWFAKRAFDIWGVAFDGQMGRLTRVLSGGISEAYLERQISVAGDVCDALARAPYGSLDNQARADLGDLGSAVTPADAIRVARETWRRRWSGPRHAAQLARELGKRMVAYEGCPAMYSSSTSAPFARACAEAHRHPDVYNFYAEMLDSMESRGYDLFNAFSLAGPIAVMSWGVWQHLESIYQQPPFDDAPKYRFLMDYIGETATAQTSSVTPVEHAPLHLQRLETGLAVTFPRAAGRATVRLLDPAGRVVRTLLRGRIAANQTLRFSVTPSELAAGVYVVEVRDNNARLCTRLPAVR